MKNFKQLSDDRCKAEHILIGSKELSECIDKVYQNNKEYNPRQLHYLIGLVLLDRHLDALNDCDN